MRATWPGARSGRISMATGPWVVSRINVLSLMWSNSLLVAPIDERHDFWSSGERIAEPGRERQRHAGVDGRDHGALVERTGLGLRLARYVGEARLAENRAGAGEVEHHRHVHAGPRQRQRRLVCLPAGLERPGDIGERVEKAEMEMTRPVARRLAR